MKEGIHPAYNQTTITCACGNVIEVGSTKKDLKVDVCSKCHPYWTELEASATYVNQVNQEENKNLNK